MSTKDDADMLRAIRASMPDGAETELLSRVASQLDRQAHDDEQYAKLQAIGKSAAECISDMVAALECDYDRLAELRELAAEVKEHLDAGSPPSHYDMTAYDKEELAELEKAKGECEDREQAEQRIHEDPLSIELTGTWILGETPTPDRALILLGTGGPAVRIVCELDASMEPHRAWLETQDWGTLWTEYRGDNGLDATLLTYCGQFYFGEG